MCEAGALLGAFLHGQQLRTAVCFRATIHNGPKDTSEDTVELSCFPLSVSHVQEEGVACMVGCISLSHISIPVTYSYHHHHVHVHAPTLLQECALACGCALWSAIRDDCDAAAMFRAES